MAATVHPASALGDPNAAINPAGQPCFGCGNAIDADQHGLVIALRDSLWHMDCFVCSTCKKKVHPDMTLLILADGSPVCMDCTYQCAACGLPIQDEAVMTGDLTYHSNCFKCQQCQKKIEDLVFAKTNHGIYCMPCHNEKAARSRRAMERRKSKRRKERPEGESPVAPLPPGKSGPGPAGNPSIPTPTSSRAESMNGVPPASPVVRDPNTSASASSNPATSPTSTHFYTPNTTPFLDSSTEFPSAKRQSFSLQSGQSEADTLRARKPSYPLPAPPARSPSPAAPPLVSTSSWDEPRAPSPKTASPIPSPTGLGFNLPQGGRTLQPPSHGSGIASHPNRRSAMMNGFLMSDPSDLHRRSFLADGPSPPPSNRSLSPQPPSHRSSPSPSSFHSANPSPEGARSTSPSLLAHDAHSFPPAHRRGRSRDPSPAPRTSRHSSLDIPPTPPPKEWRGRNRDKEMNGIVGLGMGMDLGEEVIMIDSEMREPPEGDYPEDLTRSSMDEADDMGESTRASDTVPDTSNTTEFTTPDEGEDDQPTTLAAPALPPMRFSLYGTDFSDILNRVAHSESEKNLAELATLVTSDSMDMQVEQQPASAPAGGRGFSDIKQSVSRDSGSTARAYHDVTPTGLRHIVTSPSVTSIISLNRGGSTSAPAMSSSFLDGLPPIARSPSPRISFSHSDVSAGDGEDDDVLGPLSAASLNSITTPASPSPEPVLSTESVLQKLRDAIRDGEKQGGDVRINMGLALGMLAAMESMSEKYSGLKASYDGVKRKSQHYVKGLNVAGAEYDRELTHRREVEAEVTRLRVRVSDQAARLTMLEAPERSTKRLTEQGRILKEEMDSLSQTVSKLKVERDVVIAEVEELSVSKSSASGLEPSSSDGNALSLRASHSLSQRLDEVKADYSRDLESILQQRERLASEVQELQDARQQYQEEAAALQARNEELSTLLQQVLAQSDARAEGGTISPLPRSTSRSVPPSAFVSPTPGSRLRRTDESMASVTTASTSTNLTSSLLGHDDRDESQRFVKVEKVDLHSQEQPTTTTTGRRFRWYNKSASNPNGVSAGKAIPPSTTPTPPLVNGYDKPNPLGGHNFQQHSILRLTRCEHCSEKMWGLHLRCVECGVVSHARCQAFVKTRCRRPSMDKPGPSESTVFGRDLVEQVRVDAKDGGRLIPVIVEKCIDALEQRGMDYEGIYRKTGGSSQCKNITQLFEKGNYEAFDLNDVQAFNDVSSITSVLKTYFRSLPNPLFTHALHEKFVIAGENNDPGARGSALHSLIMQLPPEHYETIKFLMLHLHRVTNLADVNRMNSQNLGVVFGPTLMRSQDRSREFSDMSGETQTVRWLIENAPVVFADPEMDY
ncbi:RhoGAP-domain-containing protein [Calocera viscosa TUFC12733]|uniref:RhoGAP-domain-containing protein n=1 Tax=Calocera viscosa (strain TUFC12733) TaxID=1330018 RepID=A0A167LCZ8_CALVF|nr:RhoGAP-domain-containing protein [Calocera viscosa TUFC12733]